MKKLVALILAVMMLMSLTAAFAEKTPTIAYVPKVIGQPWWDYVQKNVEEWGAENGFEVIYKGPADLDAAAQVQIMTDLVNQGVDILCFSAFDPNACEEVCKQALEKGIIVIGTESAGMIVRKDVTVDLKGRHVVILEDIFDTGNSLSFTYEHLLSKEPASLKICTLLDKPARRKPGVTLQADYTGFVIPNAFVVGYGLDYNEHFRNLPYVGILKPEVYEK